VICRIWLPTYWKTSWPDDAIEQAKYNNAARETLCGKPVK